MFLYYNMNIVYTKTIYYKYIWCLISIGFLEKGPVRLSEVRASAFRTKGLKLSFTIEFKEYK